MELCYRPEALPRATAVKDHLPRLRQIAKAIQAEAQRFEQEQPAQEELKKLSGTYYLVRGEDAGKPIPPEIVRTAKLTLDGNSHVVKLGDETIRGKHTVNPLENPRSIDATDMRVLTYTMCSRGTITVANNRITNVVAAAHLDIKTIVSILSGKPIALPGAAAPLRKVSRAMAHNFPSSGNSRNALPRASMKPGHQRAVLARWATPCKGRTASKHASGISVTSANAGLPAFDPRPSTSSRT